MPNRPKQKPGVMCRKIGNEYMLYDSTNESVHVINPMAEFIWGLCDGSHDVLAIVALIKEQFLAPQDDELLNDVDDILSNYQKLDLITD